MKQTVKLMLCLSLALVVVGAVGCNKADDQVVVRDDGSTVEIQTAPDGTKTEVRTFKSGDVVRVTRTTPTTGRRTARVELRDNRTVDLDDDSAIENAMEATGDAIAAAAVKTWEVTKNVGAEVADKSEDVGEAVGKGAVKAGKEVADKTEDAGGAIGSGAKKVGRGAVTVGKEVADKTEDAAQATAKGAKKLGRKIKKAVD
ncbi:MAG: hypothetical protein ACR2L2_03755 [Acidobacteriota bacterium]